VRSSRSALICCTINWNASQASSRASRVGYRTLLKTSPIARTSAHTSAHEPLPKRAPSKRRRRSSTRLSSCWTASPWAAFQSASSDLSRCQAASSCSLGAPRAALSSVRALPRSCTTSRESRANRSCEPFEGTGGPGELLARALALPVAALLGAPDDRLESVPARLPVRCPVEARAAEGIVQAPNGGPELGPVLGVVFQACRQLRNRPARSRSAWSLATAYDTASGASRRAVAGRDGP
jgi:hypothetical protein